MKAKSAKIAHIFSITNAPSAASLQPRDAEVKIKFGEVSHSPGTSCKTKDPQLPRKGRSPGHSIRGKISQETIAKGHISRDAATLRDEFRRKTSLKDGGIERQGCSVLGSAPEGRKKGGRRSKKEERKGSNER